jgi:hypothetical protein
VENEPPGVRFATASGVTAVLLVEGVSDQVALTRLAERGGRRLEDEGVAVVPMGGATNIARFLRHFGPDGLDLRLAGLCDVGEQHHFCRALERAGFGRSLSPAAMEMLGFFVSVVDLEDELIRAVGVEGVEAIIAQQGELGSFRLMQRQPAQRGRPVQDQIRRFIGGRSGLKSRYARLLVDALEPGHAPRSLAGALAHVWAR